MNFFREYALLIAIATPIVTIFAMNLYAAFNGEKGTLLLPGLMRLPKVTFDEQPPQPEIVPAVQARAPVAKTARAPAHDEVGERLAA